MYATHPKMAKRWAAHTPKGERLPDKKKKSEGYDTDGLTRDDIATTLGIRGYEKKEEAVAPRLDAVYVLGNKRKRRR